VANKLKYIIQLLIVYIQTKLMIISNSDYKQIKFIPEKETKINKVDNAKEQLIKRSQPLLSGDDGSGEDDCGALNGKAVGLWVS
jgi:hypothetical protein